MQVALALVLAEFGHYWFHRLSHQHPWVWRLHAVHHSAPRLYWLNATRFHPLDLLSLSACQSLPLVLLGFPPRTFFLYTVFASCYGQLQHGNIALRTAGFDWLFSTPLLHRWHHSVNPREGNTNYGAIVNLWDLLFGTYRRPASGEFTGAIGVQGMPRFPRDYGSHLLVPWRWDHVPRDR